MENLISSKMRRQSLLLVTVLLSLFSASFAQSVILRPNGAPQPSPTPFVKQTGEVRPRVVAPGGAPNPTQKPQNGVGINPVVIGSNESGIDVVTPDFVQQVSVAGMRGILVETADGRVLQENASAVAFNPASNVKLITALAALKKFKPTDRLQTNCFTDGTLDSSTGTLYGNLVVAGSDFSFNYEHAVNLANELNKRGIRAVTGDLIVAPTFIMNFNPSPLRSAESLYYSLDSSQRPAAATRAWQQYLFSSGKYNAVQGIPSVTISGQIYIEQPTTTARFIFAQESAPIKDLLKAMLCYSNNFMSERLGTLVGGVESVEMSARSAGNIPFEELQLASASGLGLNRVTPRAMMRVLRAITAELAKYRMNLTDICPVAGTDVGTLEKRHTSFPFRGSIVGKTGTLPQTDGGVSTLTGQISTNQGVLYFVIFNQRGSVNRFKSFQDQYLVEVANQNGGAKPFGYGAIPLSTRMANISIRNGQPPLTAVKILN